METFKIKGTTITLNRLLKLMGWCSSGAEANAIIDDGLVKVNGRVELRRRNKLEPGAKVELDGHSVIIE
ncbi:MAG TPA: RNA-binding S4 domain-containing protein [Bacteroidia bacterium]|nr:RNA-binding S4 domain-containing protein [Bacteroidia bacterium]